MTAIEIIEVGATKCVRSLSGWWPFVFIFCLLVVSVFVSEYYKEKSNKLERKINLMRWCKNE